MLDLQSIRLFVLATELGSLTRAAEAAGTVQPVVSQRLKALEARLGIRLLDRTSRFVRLTADGVAFLPRARTLLAAHDAALRIDDVAQVRLSLGLSEHALGLGLESVLRQVRSALPEGAGLSVRMDLSQTLHAGFDEGRYDAILVRREVGGGGGEVLGQDRLGWRGGAITTPLSCSPPSGRPAACAKPQSAP